MFIASLVPFVDFMYNANYTTLIRVLICITVSTVFYLISTKLITYPEGFTAVQAMMFYRACKKAEIGKPEQCGKKTVRLKEIAARFDFSREMETEALCELHKKGYELLNRKETN